jgi:hypothetical protein
MFEAFAKSCISPEKPCIYWCLRLSQKVAYLPKSLVFSDVSGFRKKLHISRKALYFLMFEAFAKSCISPEKPCIYWCLRLSQKVAYLPKSLVFTDISGFRKKL